ncbi:alpha-l-fucosidase [Mycena belliarum]|uniref:Alpha-l-fucosidase n=1 Tax=Mycena belliarum TaxID=1033014 RepID=A0AAD6TZM6_9AGAR|nr:alpha-l-fucosidase [Mycena belliae]
MRSCVLIPIFCEGLLPASPDSSVRSPPATQSLKKQPKTPTSAPAQMLLATIFLALTTTGTARAASASDTTVWFSQPATNFTTTIVIGNGRLGASHHGGVVKDQFGLNEDSIWSGSPYNPANPQASTHIPQARALVNAGNYQAAQDYLQANCMAVPLSQTTYQPAGSLLLNFTASTGEITNYKRQLDLTTSVTTLTYVQDNVTFTREAFVSHPAQVLVVRLSASKPGHLNFNASFTTPMPNPSTSVNGKTLILKAGSFAGPAPVPAGLTYENRLTLSASGATVTGVQSASESHFAVHNATTATLFVAIASSFVNYADISGDPASKNAATLAALDAAPDYAKMKAAHVAAYQAFFSRVELDFGQNAAAAVLPTDVRAQQFQKVTDPGFVALNLNFARYMLISSSWGGAQPANLQGIWNEDLFPLWNSKFTVNINLEMNYWGAEVANLADLVEPVVRLVEDVAVTGAHMAQAMYNATASAVGTGGGPGQGAPWVMHHNTDQWRATAPIDAAFYGFWPTGGVFELQTLWEHYLFDPTNTTFVQRIYPLFRGASQFFLETLQVHPNNTNWLVVNPSMSPERAFETINGEDVSTNLGVTMDNTLLRDLFHETSTFANILGVDHDFISQLAATTARLPPFLIGAGGQLQEWLTDWDSKPSPFTHLSPLYGLYPSAQINPLTNATLAAAAETLLIFRGESNDGWPAAWRVGTWARLLNASHVQSDIKLLLSSGKGIWPNLMGKNTIFQIDSTLGGLGTILESLLQSHSGEVHLLPAVPAELATGSFAGLRARGNLRVDAAWTAGTLSTATITSTLPSGHSSNVTVRLGNSAKTVMFALKGGAARQLHASDFV